MRIVALIPLVAFLLVTMVVGVRLLALARRTRELPEAAIGGGLVLMGLVGLPLCAVGRMPATIGTPLGDVCFVVGSIIAALGVELLFVFTWAVFRRDERAASAIPFAGGAILLVAVIGLTSNGTGETDLDKLLPLTRPYALMVVGAVASAFLWSGVESARYYAMLGRRLRIGLADPVVTNRFGLWAIAGISAALMSSAIGGFVAAGVAVLVEPLPIATIAVVGTATSVAFSLSFLPPQRYLEGIRARAAKISP